MKVSFLTDSGFLSHKLEILAKLNQKVDLLLVVFYVDGFKNLTEKDITDFALKNEIRLELVKKGEYRSRDLRRISHDYRKILKPILRFKPDVYYIESFGSPYVSLLSALLFPSNRVIMAMHDFQLHEIGDSKQPLSARIYQKVAIRFFKHFHLFSFSQRALFEKAHPKKTTFVIRLYLVGRFYAKPSSKKINTATNFLFFGRIFHYKGVDILIEASDILAKKRQDFKVTIAGHTADPEAIRSLVSNPQLFDLNLNYVPKENISGLFNEADFLVLPYRDVTQSGPLLIGYNFNVIPIASNEHGFTEYIDHQNTGLIFESKKPEKLAEVMQQALEIKSEERQAILNRIKEFKAREFDLQKVAEDYVKMFQQVIKG